MRYRDFQALVNTSYCLLKSLKLCEVPQEANVSIIMVAWFCRCLAVTVIDTQRFMFYRQTLGPRNGSKYIMDLSVEDIISKMHYLRLRRLFRVAVRDIFLFSRFFSFTITTIIPCCQLYLSPPLWLFIQCAPCAFVLLVVTKYATVFNSAV